MLYKRKQEERPRASGAYTEYSITIFHATNIDKKHFKLGKNDRWISLHEMQKGITNDDVEIFKSSQQLIEKMQNVSYSIDITERANVIDLVGKHSKFIGIIIAILTLLATIITIFK